MNRERPIEIVGGGLAGLSLGLALRQHDVPVTISDAGRYPRHRVCGEFITGLSAPTRQRLGLDPFLTDAVANRTIAWFVGDRYNHAQTLPAPALSLSRFRLDRRLADAFVAAGGVLRPNTRVAVERPREGRVLATGRRRARSPWIGLKVHVADVPLTRDLELHLGDAAYVGLARIEGDRVNLCGLFRRRPLDGDRTTLLPAYLRAAGLAALAERLDRALCYPDSFCAVAGVAFDSRAPSCADARLGDAHAMIPPFTGHGMAMAFQSAELALAPLIAYARGERNWPETTRLIALAVRRRFRRRLASAGLLHPFLLEPARRPWLAWLGRSGLLPLRPLYAAVH